MVSGDGREAQIDYEKSLRIRVEGRSVTLITDGDREIHDISASEIVSFMEPDWLVMRKQLIFRMRYRDFGTPVANPWEVTVDFLAVPPTICPNCRAKLH